MGRNSCSVKQKLRKGLWSPEEDEKLFNYISRFGVGCWSSVPKLAGLQRCGKSCRLRWINYLRPDLKRGTFSQQEEDLIISLHQALGNRWAQIASQLPGRTDNEIKNLWNSSLKKKLIKQGIDPNTHKEIQVKDEKDTNPTRMDQHLNNTGELQAYDHHPAFLSEFQQGVFGFNSMPDDNSASRMSTNQIPQLQINSDVVENSTTLSWDVENKFDSMFQFQCTGILTEDFSDYAFQQI